MFLQVGAILPPEQRPLLLWLRNLPDPVVEQVFTSFLNLHLGIKMRLVGMTTRGGHRGAGYTTMALGTGS